MSLELIAAQTLATFNVIYLNTSWKAALADASAASTTFGISIAKTSIATDAIGEFYQIGDIITNESWSWNSGLIYISDVAGALTQTLTTGPGEQLQIIGFATSATSMVLFPQLVVVETA